MPNLGALQATWVPWIASLGVEADAQRCCCCFFSSRALRAATYTSSDAGGATSSSLISPLPSVPLPGGLSAAQRQTTGEGRWEGRRLWASTEEGEGSDAPPGELEGPKLEGLAHLASSSAAFTFNAVWVLAASTASTPKCTGGGGAGRGRPCDSPLDVPSLGAGEGTAARACAGGAATAADSNAHVC